MKLIPNHKLIFLKIYFIIFYFLLVYTLHAQTSSPRSIISMNEGWQFVKGDSIINSSGWQTIQLPHTWNTGDVLDDMPGYYRGVGWYKKTFKAGNELKDKEVSFYFEGSNQETEVFINGKKADHHIGGYTGFSVRATPHLKFNASNELLVKVNNRYNENIPPLTADFTFYGGIYRDVYLIASNKIHFSTNDYGSKGIYITTPFVSKENATVNIKTLISNEGKPEAKIFVITSIVNAGGEKVAETRTPLLLPASSDKTLTQKLTSIKNPKLWSPENPYLYKAITRITDAKGKVLDVITNSLGFRWFSFDADKGFLLNGHLYKLIGASRHQDYKGLGNAVPDRLAVEDVILLKKMGANFLRIAHYPQDPCVVNACDSLGLLTSIEIPIVNEITESDSFYRNCEHMLTEMIRQNFNHPGVIMWGYMNEVLLKSHFANDKERQKIYIANITALAQRLEKLVRDEDPNRYTMMADHGNLNQYKNAGLLEIPMVIGWNLYSGWYGGSMDDFPVFLDQFHKEFPNKPFMVTEYGADADPRIRSAQPVRFDKSIEYAMRFHQYYFKKMMARPYVAGCIIWNLADFNSETRTETMPHINNKGLLEWDRKPKDTYFFYQAILSRQPFIKILGSHEKFGVADSTSSFGYQTIQVASNLDSVTILLNGNYQTKLKVVNGLCESKLPFKDVSNTIIAKGETNNKLLKDSISTQIHLQAPCLSDKRFPFREINIMLGSTRYFVDEKGEWWQPDQVYKKGGWGSIGGKKFKTENNGRLPYGSDKNISGTDDDPVYQTQQTGIQQYRLDVLPGKYELMLHFAELLGGKAKILPYNLKGGEKDAEIKRRIFNVNVNGQTILDHFNIADDYGLAKAVIKSTTVVVHNDEGIVIDFVPIEGEPVLNALQLKRIDSQIEK